MASEVQICNLALSQLGAYKIESLSESTEEARQCNLHYDNVRDSVLSAHAWDFATKQLTLALLTDTYEGYDYAYSYPNDCLVAREIYSDSDTKIKFEIIADSDLTSKVIITDEEDAVLIYTARVTDPNMYSPLFVNALSLALASTIVQPLKKDPALFNKLYNQYIATISSAKTMDAHEGYVEQPETCDFIDARS